MSSFSKQYTHPLEVTQGHKPPGTVTHRVSLILENTCLNSVSQEQARPRTSLVADSRISSQGSVSPAGALWS